MTQVADLAVVTAREDYTRESEDPSGSMNWGLYTLCTCSMIKNTDYSLDL